MWARAACISSRSADLVQALADAARAYVVTADVKLPARADREEIVQLADFDQVCQQAVNLFALV
jgi:hypothetical protein